MDDTFSFFESEINDTKQVIEAATIKLKTLQDLLRKYREQHPPSGQGDPVTTFPIQGSVSLNPDIFDDGADNKTQLVLDVIIKHQSNGVKAGGVIARLPGRERISIGTMCIQF